MQNPSRCTNVALETLLYRQKGFINGKNIKEGMAKMNVTTKKIMTYASALLIVFVIFSIVTSFVLSEGNRSDNALNCVNNENILYVGGSGPGNYTKIQDAINVANDGDAIIVYYGYYNESVTISKTLSLFGVEEEGKKPIIYGGKNNSTVSIFADNCMLKSFKIMLEKYMGISVRVFSSLISIEDVIIQCRFYADGISLYNSSYSTFTKNKIYEVNDGISLYNSSNCNISMNTFHGVNDYPIILENSYKNIISENDIEDVCRIAIDLWGSSNNSIFDNALKGIEMYSSNSNRIYDNLLSNSIELDRSKENYILNNIIKDGHFIQCWFSSYDIIKNNVFHGGGIWLDSNSIHHWTTHVIENNTLNGKPIRYYKNEENLLISGEASQIILANCNYCTIENMNISGSNRAILLGLSNNNVISDCALLNNGLSISLKYSNDNSIIKNTISNNKRGIIIFYSDKTRIFQNTMRGNEVAISTYDTRHTVIEKNILSGNDRGLWIGDSFLNRIVKNNLENSEEAIYLDQAMINFVLYNNFIGNEKNTFVDNSFKNIFLRNYWSNWRLPLPKPILCLFYIPWVFGFRYLIFDWLPRLIPYGGENE